MQWSACRPTSSRSTRVRPLSSSTTWNSCGPSPSVDAGPERRVRVHPLAGGGARQQLQEDLEVGEARQQLLDPEHRDEHRRQRRAHPPVALGLDDADRARLGDAEVGAADADARGQEPLAQVDAGRLGEIARVVGLDARRDRPREQVADLGAVAVDRGHEDVRRPVAVELEDQLGEVRLQRVDARLGERGVETDLVRGQRLDLHDLVDAVRAGDRGDGGVRLRGVARPVHVPARRDDGRLELEQVLVEMGEHVGLDRLARPRAAPPSRAARRRRCARFARIVSVALRRFVRSWTFASSTRAASGKLVTSTRGSRRCEPAGPRSRGARARRRSAAGTSCRRRCRTPRRSTRSRRTCPRASRSTCRRS